MKINTANSTQLFPCSARSCSASHHKEQIWYQGGEGTVALHTGTGTGTLTAAQRLPHLSAQEKGLSDLLSEKLPKKMEQKFGFIFLVYNSGNLVKLIALLLNFWGSMTTFWLVQALLPIDVQSTTESPCQSPPCKTTSAQVDFTLLL